MIKLTNLTLEEAILLRDAIADKKCLLSTVEVEVKGVLTPVVKPVDHFTGKRKEMIQSCIDLKNVLNSQIVRSK
jgi:hypothetical protein